MEQERASDANQNPTRSHGLAGLLEDEHLLPPMIINYEAKKKIRRHYSCTVDFYSRQTEFGFLMMLVAHDILIQVRYPTFRSIRYNSKSRMSYHDGIG